MVKGTLVDKRPMMLRLRSGPKRFGGGMVTKSPTARTEASPQEAASKPPC